MKNFNANFLEAAINEGGQPQAYVKINTTENYDIYLTTHKDIITVVAPDILIEGVITGLTTSSESVTPEKGISVTGRGSVSLNEAEFTDELRDLIALDKTVFNNKVEVYSGDATLDIADFEKVNTLYLEDITSNEVTYNLSLITPQVFTDKRIFEKTSTELFTGFNAGDDLTEIEVLSTDELDLVAHDSQWGDSPSEEVGYLEIQGQDENGNIVTEVMKYWSKDATKFYGDPSNSNLIERSVFRTGRVTATGTSDSDTATAVNEYIYIDLACGKLLIALLTGDLYGQVGKTLPAHWHAGIDAAFVNITSIENIGFDLWNPADDTGFHFYIDNLNATESKSFIAREILRVSSLVFLTDVNGEIAAKRYSQVIAGASTATVLVNDDITNSPSFARKSGDIRNIFAVKWDYDQTDQRFRRNEVFIDSESQTRNGIISSAEIISLKAIKNNQLEVGELLKTVTDGIRTRLTNAKLTPTIQTNFRRTVALELMDVIGLDLTGYSDYSATGDINRPFEIQKIQHNWIDRSVSMQLYGSTDPSSPIDISIGTEKAVINNAGRLAFESNLTGSFTDTGSLLTLTGTCLLGNVSDKGTYKKYYYDGDIDLNGQILQVFGSVSIDAKVFDATGSTIDGVGFGGQGGLGQLFDQSINLGTIKGSSGYFGNFDSAEEGEAIYSISGNNQNNSLLNRSRRAGNTIRQGDSAGKNVIDNFVLEVNENGDLLGEPDALHGMSGSGGARTLVQPLNTSPSLVGVSGGGRGANGGAGIMLFVDNFVYNNSTLIDMSAGAMAALPPVVQVMISGTSPWNVVGGQGGMAYGGCFGVFIKDRTNPLFSNSDSNFTSKASTRLEYTGYNAIDRPNETGQRVHKRDSNNLTAPFFNTSATNNVSGHDYANSALISKYIGSAVANVPQVGRDPIGLIAAPTNLLLTESIDTPSSPLGNISTITNNVTDPVDANYLHTTFEFRRIGQDAYYPMTYKVSNESTFEVTSDGSQYEVKAQSVSKQGVLGGIITNTITVKNVLTEPAIEPEVQIPKVTGIQLKNRIAPNEFGKFKSGNAEFIWNAVSNNFGISFGNEGALGANSGSFDPYFKDYQVNIYDESNFLIRTETTKTESYTYTYDKNKVDNNGTAQRDFSIQVIARGQNNQVGEGRLIPVENPEPAAPTSIKNTVSYNSIQVEYVAPNDIDFIGVNVRYKKTGGLFTAFVFFATTACQVGDLDSGQEYEIELQSVDQFGTGATTSTIVSTQAIEAAEIDGLSNWATETNPVDLAFIQANMANGAVESDKVVSLVAGKITAGQIDVAVDIGTGVRLDGATGTVTTTTNDFNVIVGNADGSWNQLPNPTAITNLNTGTNTQTFGVDVLGNMIIGEGDNAVTFINGVIGFGSNVTIGSNSNQTVTVGAGGDYSDWNGALEAISKIVPAYNYGGFTATINILSGTVLEIPLLIDGVDLSFIEITSDDAVVDVNQNGVSGNTFIRITNGARAPKMNILLNDIGTNTSIGVSVDGAGSILSFDGTGTGMTNFTFAIKATNSGYIFADSTTLTNSTVALYAFDNGIIIADRANADNSSAVIDVRSNGQISFAFGSGKNATGSSVVNALNARLNLDNADFSNWTNTGGTNRFIIFESTGDMSAVDMSTTVIPTNKVLAIQNSTLIAPSLKLSTNSGAGKADIEIQASDISMIGSRDYHLFISNGTIARVRSSVNATFAVTVNNLTGSGIIFD